MQGAEETKNLAFEDLTLSAGATRLARNYIVNFTVNGGVLETTAWPSLSRAGL